MPELKYKVITSDNQYRKYCNILTQLHAAPGKTIDMNDEIALLQVLIEKYRTRENSYNADLNPVELLKSLIAETGLNGKDFAGSIGISPTYLYMITTYQRDMTKRIILKLAERFSLPQEAFSRPYEFKRQAVIRDVTTTTE